AVVDADTEAGWVSEGRAHPWTVPVRAVPRNVVRQAKWKLIDDELKQVTKWRVTTDDSMTAGEGDVSRNAGIDDDGLGNVDLPVLLRDFGEAVAIVRAVSARMGMTFPARGVERVALWALDSSSACRMLASARTERWQQQFVWADGVHREDRCVFGTKSLVDFFERVSTFVLAVAKYRIAEYDEVHPYDGCRRQWRAARKAAGLSDECTFADIYIDDGFGLTCVGPDEDIAQTGGFTASLERATFLMTRRLYRGGKLVEKRKERVKPRQIKVRARSAAAREFCLAVRWWRETLAGGVSVPLAPKLVFQHIGEAGCLFVFTNAAREDGTGFGGFMVITEGVRGEPMFLYVEQGWPAESLGRLQRDEWSMPAGEMFGAAMIMSAVAGLLAKLHEAAADRMKSVYAPKSKDTLNTALRSFARFAMQCPERVLFREKGDISERQAAAWNEWTFILYAMWLAGRPSRQTKHPVRARTTESYISLIKGYLRFEYDFELPERAPRLSRLLKAMKDEDPLAGVRKKRKALRRRHLRSMWRKLSWVGDTSVTAVNEHALLATAWQVLARGGELAPTCGSWDALRCPSRSYHVGRRGTRDAVLWLRPLKKKGAGVQPKVPQLIAEYDGQGSDAYAALRRMERYEADRERTPLFRKMAGGRMVHMSVRDMRACVQKRMLALGYEKVSEWGAHSCRIGGATDLMATGQATQLLLQAKGRWASDVGKIYARMTRNEQIAASKLMQSARGRDLEELLPGFVQPA
ncbi:MAG: hypothetical protein SGPRY_013776, partial [Prymnesium sp.]